MKTAIPYCGNLWIPLAGLLCEVGLELILPDANPMEYLRLGNKHVYQGRGTVFKLQVGSYLAALESGAEQLLMIIDYSQGRNQIAPEAAKTFLQELGYDFQTIKLDFSRLGFLRGISKIAKGKQKIKGLSGVKRFWRKVEFLAYLEENRLVLGDYMSVYEQQYYELILKDLLNHISVEDLQELIWKAEALFEVLAKRGDGRACQYLRFDQWLKGNLGYGKRKKVEEYLNSAISV